VLGLRVAPARRLRRHKAAPIGAGRPCRRAGVMRIAS
jgi:hypothetical protein